jgi:uncharacterized protein
VDLASRLRAIVRPGVSPSGNAAGGLRELIYEPDSGPYAATLDLDRAADALGGRVVANSFGRALVVDRRYESDRWHGTWRVGECEVSDGEHLRLLDPALPLPDGCGSRMLFVDLETTGLSGGAGTMAFLVGCGWFDVGAFQVRQFLLTSHAAERALLHAVAECFEDTALLVTYNGKTFDVPVMETRWSFHRMSLPLADVRHFDMLHPARRLWKIRTAMADSDGCSLGTLERILGGVTRVGDVPGLEIPARYFRFIRSGDARPLEPVLEHNRLDLISLAAVTAHAVRLAAEGACRCRDAAEAVALGRVLERAGDTFRAIDCYRHAAEDASAHADVRAEALSRWAVRLRRDHRFADAAAVWRLLLDLKPPRFRRRASPFEALRQLATEALAIHHEHRERDYEAARGLALQLLEDEAEDEKVRSVRHRLARLDRKLAAKPSSGNDDSHLFV